MEWSPKVLGHTADVVQRLREEQGLSTERLAKKAGISKNTVYSLEKGNPVGLDKLDAIFHALGVENWPQLFSEYLWTARRSRGANYAAVMAEGPPTLRAGGMLSLPVQLGDRKGLLVINLLDLTPGDEQPELPY
jgi:transcriptional regulator with XRE-family HTH domain